MPETTRHPIALAPMRAGDLDAVLDVQAACYPPAMQEAADVVLARRLVARLLADAAACGLRHSALVSVQDSRAFWESLGYAAAAAGGRRPGRARHVSCACGLHGDMPVNACETDKSL